MTRRGSLAVATLGAAFVVVLLVRRGSAGEMESTVSDPVGLAKLDGLGVIDDLARDGETLILDGQTMHVASTTVRETPSAVLDRADAACTGTSHRTPVEAVCVSADRKLSRVSARAIRDSAPDGPRTHVVTAWTERPLDPRPFFAREGDAPGTDSALAARPAGSRRVLTASVAGTPYALRVYETPASPRDAVAAIDASLVRNGLVRATRTDDGARAGGTWFRAGTDVVVFAERDPEGTLVSILEVRPR